MYINKRNGLSIILVEVETDEGHLGHGITMSTDENVLAEVIKGLAGPMILGEDAMATERVWEKLYWQLTPRGQTGYGGYAIAAIDVALWDIKGKFLCQPVSRLLGGTRKSVPLYATFGFFDGDQIGEAAKLWREKWFEWLKMTVGMNALKRRDDEMRPLMQAIREDRIPVRNVREGAGDDAEIFVDANCSLDQYHAITLANWIEEFDISFFEEPITHNNVRQMAEMRTRTKVAVAAGQTETLAYRFRDFITENAVDVLQPNVVIGGGFTQILKVAGMAAAFNVPIDNGGAFPFHNMHLHAGVMNGGMVEYHRVSVECCKALFKGLPEPKEGWPDLPEAPGLGFGPDMDVVRELAKAPKSMGQGKGCPP
ncbi:MAG: D-galactarolactone cycloisomerase [Alphaproteobacteria bacterium MarineAlpha4_Bin2]|nr:MAG: D-galactarolactone cycloisomerase [Alphaproteobacteria bacterium MarineAlpha4_Bin2]